MGKKVLVNLNMDEDLKKGFEEVCRDLGITLTAAITMFAAKTEHGFFVKDGEDAMCVIGMFIPEITRKDVHYLDYLDEWTFDVDGEVEDCIKESRDWISHHERRYVG